jgi:hypothetical protein
VLEEDDQFLRIKELFHFTDRRNLPQIRDCGGIWSTELLRVGQVEFFAGGDAASLDLDVQGGWDTYVRLCFTQNHPMAHHVVQRESSPGVIYL